MTTTIVITSNLINSNSFLKEFIEKELLSATESKRQEILQHFISNGYSEEEIKCEVEFSPAFRDTYLTDNYKLRVSGTAANIVKSETKYIDWTYYYISDKFSKDRNEKGMKIKAAIDHYFEKEKQKKAEVEAEETRKKEAEKQEKEQAKENLRQWALQNGSELLKLRIEEDMNWYQLANDEYFASIMPEGFTCLKEPDEDYPINNATIEQIKALREVKQQYPDAKLMRYKYNLIAEEDYEGEDDDERYEHKDVIAITLKSLSGEERVFEKEL